jgi:hypothetical protein
LSDEAVLQIGALAAGAAHKLATPLDGRRCRRNRAQCRLAIDERDAGV